MKSLETLTINEIKEIAQEGNFENWLNPTSVGRGWYTCELTNKKFRGEEAKKMIAEQEAYLIEMESQDPVGFIEEPTFQDVAIPVEHAKLPQIKVLPDEKPLVVATVWDTVSLNGQDIQVVKTGVLDNHIIVKQSIEAKPVKTTVINCCDCGTPREIKVQDQFQVKRCPVCQKAHRNAKRREARKLKKETMGA